MSETFDRRTPGEDQFIGAMLGGGIGDALGWPVEGKGRAEILTQGDLVSTYRPVHRPGKDIVYSPGSYSDDTQQSLVVAESIIACGCVDRRDIAQRLLDLWKSGRAVGYGKVFRIAMERLDAGVPVDEAGDAEVPWNGAAMRVGPVALYDWNRPEQLATDVVASSTVTHREPSAVAAALAVAEAVRYVLTHQNITAQSLIAAIVPTVARFDQDLARRLAELPRVVTLSADDARAWLLAVPGSRWEGRTDDGVSVQARPTTLASLYAFLRAPSDLRLVIETSLLLGGDVDSFAAIAGFLVGAFAGTAAFPSNLVDGLQDSAQIRTLGNKLYQIATS